MFGYMGKYLLPVIKKKTVVFSLFASEFLEVTWDLLFWILSSLLDWMLNTRGIAGGF